MTFLLIVFLLQAQIPLPGRTALENPSVRNPVPRQLQKDYDKLWKRFLSGKEDARVLKDSEKLLKKNADAVAPLLLQSYVDIYAGRLADGERKLQSVLSRRPSEPIALFYLAEIAYAREDFVGATHFYTRLGRADPSGIGIDMKRQRALLLAMETLVQRARQASSENRLSEAERLYRQALELAPQEPLLRKQLAEVLSLQGKTDEAEQIANRALFSGEGEHAPRIARPPEPEWDDLTRWGTQIDHFHQLRASQAITREQLAALLARYFPQLTGVQRPHEVLTDVEDSWAQSSIQAVVAAGILDPMPTHAFQPTRTVSRGEFAEAVARLTRLLHLFPQETPPISPLDVVPGSTLYRELQPVLGFGLLSLDNAGNFDVSAPVGGEEAVNIAEKLLRLIDKSDA
jgi:tetratricopeptide (TPR) repeat protein